MFAVPSCISFICARLRRPPSKPPPPLRVRESIGILELFIVAPVLEGPEMELFCRPVPKLLNTSAKPDGAVLASGVRGEPSGGGGIGLIIWIAKR